MVTRMWVFPGGEEIDLNRFDNEIARLQASVQATSLLQGPHQVPVEGMVDQMYDYTVIVEEERTLLQITGRPEARTRSGRRARPGTQTHILPDEAPSAPIMSGKYDGNTYLFALIEVSES